MVKIKAESKPKAVYFGHPGQFWRMRQHCDSEILINVEEMKKTMDIVDYDAIHLQKIIINKAQDKVKQLIYDEEIKLRHRRCKLQILLQKEDAELKRELEIKQAMTDCNYCKEKQRKLETYRDDIEKETARECLKALEREKIANGLRFTKIDEIQLREMQKMQMQEKMFREQQQKEIDQLWHQVLLNGVKMKEEKERFNSERHKKEMYERRQAYDDQIASANRNRQEALQKERHIENSRLEKMKKKMEQDYYDDISKKKDRQLTNKQNFLKGHEIKLTCIKNEKRHEREKDVKANNIAMEELRREKQKEFDQMQMLRREKELFVENINRERKLAHDLEEATIRITSEWRQQSEKQSDEYLKKIELQKQRTKQQAAKEYNYHIENINKELKNKRLDRKVIMDKVKMKAYDEIRKNLDSANEELKRQIEYRNMLTKQIKDNQRIMELELTEIVRKQLPFVKKATMFKDAMKYNIGYLSTRENHIHPFKKVMQKNEAGTIASLPLINKYGI